MACHKNNSGAFLTRLDRALVCECLPERPCLTSLDRERKLKRPFQMPPASHAWPGQHAASRGVANHPSLDPDPKAACQDAPR
eukprot:365662-Chlamydomonas_euryale.AAC.6